MKKKILTKKALLTWLWLAATCLPVLAQARPNPYLRTNESWISLSGTVTGAAPGEFQLDYGSGAVKVEMDDWGWYSRDMSQLKGHKVTVYGKIDDDFYETTKIEASSVYDRDRGVYFYANAADEEYDEDYDYWVAYTPFVTGELTIRGTVTGVNGREFTIDQGTRRLIVDTDEMTYNPMDAQGYQKIDKGDYVSVSGRMDYDLFEERELKANSIVVLIDD